MDPKCPVLGFCIQMVDMNQRGTNSPQPYPALKLGTFFHFRETDIFGN